MSVLNVNRHIRNSVNRSGSSIFGGINSASPVMGDFIFADIILKKSIYVFVRNLKIFGAKYRSGVQSRLSMSLILDGTIEKTEHKTKISIPAFNRRPVSHGNSYSERTDSANPDEPTSDMSIRISLGFIQYLLFMVRDIESVMFIPLFVFETAVVFFLFIT